MGCYARNRPRANCPPSDHRPAIRPQADSQASFGNEAQALNAKAKGTQEHFSEEAQNEEAPVKLLAHVLSICYSLRGVSDWEAVACLPVAPFFTSVWPWAPLPSRPPFRSKRYWRPSRSARNS